MQHDNMQINKTLANLSVCKMCAENTRQPTREMLQVAQMLMFLKMDRLQPFVSVKLFNLATPQWC